VLSKEIAHQRMKMISIAAPLLRLAFELAIDLKVSSKKTIGWKVKNGVKNIHSQTDT
jgi:hypothetical protein